MILAKNDPLRRWLERATPEDRHLFVAGWDSESASAVLDWMIRQPDCEKATALLAYWLQSPVYFAEYGRPEWNDFTLMADYRLTREIEKRYIAGFYRNQSIGFDPSNAFAASEERIDFTAGYTEIVPVAPIPPEMFVPVKGKTPVWPEGWNNGMPADVEKAWSDFLEREGWKQLRGVRTTLRVLVYGLRGSVVGGILGITTAMLLAPIANQGRLPRGLVTGLLGFLLGGIVGVLYAVFRLVKPL